MILAIISIVLFWIPLVLVKGLYDAARGVCSVGTVDKNKYKYGVISRQEMRSIENDYKVGEMNL